MSTLSSVSTDGKVLPEPIHGLNVITTPKDKPSTSPSGHHSPKAGQNEVDSSPVPISRFELNPFYKSTRILLDPSLYLTSPDKSAQAAMSCNNTPPASNFSNETASSLTIPCGSLCNTVSPGLLSASLSEVTQTTMADNIQSAPATPGLLSSSSASQNPYFATPSPSSAAPNPNSSAPNHDSEVPSPSSFTTNPNSAPPSLSSAKPIPSYIPPSSGCYDTVDPTSEQPSPSHSPPSLTYSPSSSPHCPSYEQSNPYPFCSTNGPSSSPPSSNAASFGYNSSPPSPGSDIPCSPSCYSEPSPGCYDTPSPNYDPPTPSYVPPSPSYDPHSPSYDPPSPSYIPLSPSYDPPSPSYIPLSPSYDPPRPSYDPPSPSYDPHSPSYDPTSPSYVPFSPIYDPTSPSYDPHSPSYVPTIPSYDLTSPAYDPPGPSFDRRSPSYDPPKSSYETLSSPATLVPSVQRSLSPLSPSVSPSKTSTQSSTWASSRMSNGSSASSSNFSTPTSSKHSKSPCSSTSSPFSGFSTPECRSSCSSSIVDIASSPSLDQSPRSIIDAKSSSTSNCSQLLNMTGSDEGVQMTSSQTTTKRAIEPLPSTVSNRQSKRKFWEHEIGHVKKLKHENGNIRLICIEAEYIKQNNENRKDLTHIGCSILCVDKSGSVDQQESFFRVIEPPRMKDYLSMKMKGDLLKSLHIQQNETGQFEFRDEFQIIDDQNKLIECVTEDKALEDFINFITKFHPCVLVSLDERILKIILIKVQVISNISPFSRSPWISWTQILSQLDVSNEDIVMDFEDWFTKNMNPADNTIPQNPHALDISAMLVKAIKHVALTKKNVNLYRTLSSITSFPSIENLGSFNNAEILAKKFEYVELFNSLRPHLTPTIYFESVEVVDLSSDSDDGQAKVTPISWSILSHTNQNSTQNWNHPQFNFPPHSGQQSYLLGESPWAPGYYTRGNMLNLPNNYISNANLQARFINRHAQSSFSGCFTNGPTGHQGAGPSYPQQISAQMASTIGRIPQNQNNRHVLQSSMNASIGTSAPSSEGIFGGSEGAENSATVARAGNSVDPRQCIGLNNRACGNKNKVSCAFKMCGSCCKIEKRNEPCIGHGRR